MTCIASVTCTILRVVTLRRRALPAIDKQVESERLNRNDALTFVKLNVCTFQQQVHILNRKCIMHKS